MKSPQTFFWIQPRAGLGLLFSIFCSPHLAAQSFTYIKDNSWSGFVESAFLNEAPFDETNPKSQFETRTQFDQFPDAVGGVAMGKIDNLRGGHTMTDGANSFDLSTVGSSVTILTRSHFFRTGNFFSSPRTGRNVHSYQLGLSTGTDHFGAAGNESLFVAYDYQDSEFFDIVDDPSTGLVDRYFGNLDVLSHVGYDATIDNQWNHSPLATLATDVTASVMQANHSTGSHSIALRYTNLGSGQMEVAMSVRELYWDSREGALTTLPPAIDEVIVNNRVIVNHDFTDLSALRPAFGLALDTNQQGLGSGHIWNWNPEFEAPEPIPEPSALLLVAFGSLGLLRRKRSH